ncbi:hypothetical protein GQ55_8G187000 [Panicum hallii var. hallii]|uniref:C2 domain-containing protein n=1 Tax=Panicum hallii var. hallii TaxID=1504633 RepID=A0A2T7CNU9_9POAL|nr:hypothetical protein GQ55_8G187000 [Panicum hallii var. hallii]
MDKYHHHHHHHHHQHQQQQEDSVMARDLPPIVDVTACTVDPFVEVKAGNLKGVTKHRENNPYPEWRQTFAFPREHLLRQYSSQLEVVVKDKDVIRNEFVGHVVFDMADIPESQVAPQWYSLAHRNGDKLHHGEIMLAVWTGIQAEDACCRHSDAHHSVPTGASPTGAPRTSTTATY